MPTVPTHYNECGFEFQINERSMPNLYILDASLYYTSHRLGTNLVQYFSSLSMINLVVWDIREKNLKLQ